MWYVITSREGKFVAMVSDYELAVQLNHHWRTMNTFGSQLAAMNYVRLITLD